MDIYERYGRLQERLEEQVEATAREFAAHVATISVLRHLKDGELELEQLSVDPTEPMWSLTPHPAAFRVVDEDGQPFDAPASLAAHRNGWHESNAAQPEGLPSE